MTTWSQKLGFGKVTRSDTSNVRSDTGNTRINCQLIKQILIMDF